MSENNSTIVEVPLGILNAHRDITLNTSKLEIDPIDVKVKIEPISIKSSISVKLQTADDFQKSNADFGVSREPSKYSYNLEP